MQTLKSHDTKGSETVAGLGLCFGVQLHMWSWTPCTGFPNADSWQAVRAGVVKVHSALAVCWKHHCTTAWSGQLLPSATSRGSSLANWCTWTWVSFVSRLRRGHAHQAGLVSVCTVSLSAFTAILRGCWMYTVGPCVGLTIGESPWPWPLRLSDWPGTRPVRRFYYSTPCMYVGCQGSTGTDTATAL